jgi:hypothetical protein
MNPYLMAVSCGLTAAPFLAMAALLFWYVVRRAVSRHRWRTGKRVKFFPSPAELGFVFLLALTFYRPAISHVIETQLREDVEQDDEGDPESPENALNAQLKRIRMGERVDYLVTRVDSTAWRGAAADGPQ